MSPAPVAGPARLVRRVEIETPEGVTVGLELAGVGSRTLAAIYDGLLVILLLLLTGAAFLAVQISGSAWAGAALVLVSFTIVWGYFALFEGLWNGRTPGKRRVGIRVVMDTGEPVTFAAAAVRGLVRVVDYQPGLSGLVGLLFILFHPQAKRLGDLVAGTLVVRDEPEELRPIAAAPSVAVAPQPIAPRTRLSDDEFRLLERYLARAADLAPELRRRFQRDLAERFADRYPEWPATHPRFVREVRDAEAAARQAPGAARRDSAGLPRLRIADRFVARNRDAWERFRERAALLEREGLSGATGNEILEFAAAYRGVAADLARATTYRVEPQTLTDLERAVASGHNALYGLRRRPRPQLRRLLLRRLPAEVVRHRAYVLVALALFFLPGIAGYTLVRERPGIAFEVLPDVILARAATGADERELGMGYAETPSPFLPLVASGIIANNVQVAFGAFAFGITAGIGTVLVLLFNGLFFGAVLGHYANVGLAGWILTFVAGHGVLELTAIFVAGGAGLIVAHALVVPGDLARPDALVLRGRSAIRLVGAAACLLVLAGLIEGFLSASGAPPALKVGVSGATLLLLGLWLVSGGRLPVSGTAQPPSADR